MTAARSVRQLVLCWGEGWTAGCATQPLELTHRVLEGTPLPSCLLSLQTLVRCEAFAAAAWKLDLHELMAVGRGYEGLEPTPHMLAGSLGVLGVLGVWVTLLNLK